MQVEISVEIDAPIEDVFDFTLNHVPEWSSTVLEDEVIEATPDHVGSTFRCLTEDHGRRFEMMGTVTHYDAPHASTVYLECSQFDVEAAYQFEELEPGRTRVTQVSTVKMRGFMKVFMFFFGWLLKKGGCKTAQNEFVSLKRILEERAAGPND